jgi:predicted SprT family Zn-dependent metalloprotease
VDLKPILAVTIGIAVFRGIISPMVAHYLSWRDGSRVQVARRNWRGVYMPDLNVKRGERIFWLAYLAIVALGLAIGWTIMVPA